MSESFEKWITLGERLGFEGEELQNFVLKREQEVLEREERASKRQMEKEEMARQYQEEEAERNRIHEIEKLKMQTAIEQIKKETEHDKTEIGAHLEIGDGSRSLRPKLPKFEEKDDMDAFLERFEKFAIAQKWPQEQWAISLSPLLTGNGLQVYSSMSADTVNDYMALKKALLKRYELTAEGFRTKFRDCKPEKGETAFQFVARITRYLDRWTEMSEVNETFDDLKDLLVREQFIQSCAPSMAVFLKERAPKNVQELTQFAEQYIEAHGGNMTKPTQRSDNPSLNQFTRNSQHFSSQVQNSSSMNKNSGRQKACFVCGGQGHLAKDHMSNGKLADSARQGNYSNWRNNNPYRHKNNGIPVQNSSGQFNSNKAALCETVGKYKTQDDNCETNQLASKAGTPSGDKLQLQCESNNDISNNDTESNVCKGYVGENLVKVLRDTGCTGAAIRKELVSDDQMTGKEIFCVLIDGTLRKFPVAMVTVDTPYFVGDIEAMCMEQPIYDLVIGNIDSASLIPNKNWKPINGKCEAAVVTTRAQAKRDEKPIKPLKVPIVNRVISKCGTDELKAAQKADPTLTKWYSAVESNQPVNNQGVKFSIDKGILYRTFTKKYSDTTQDIKQIVVPKEYRENIMSLAHHSIVGGHLGSQKTRLGTLMLQLNP